MNRAILVSLVLLVLQGCGITAPKNNAGFADLDALSGQNVDAVMILSLGRAPLKLAAWALQDEPEKQALIAGLDGIRVKVYEIDGDLDDVVADVNQMSSDLREDGWQQVVRVKEPQESTHVLMKMEGDSIAGLTVLTTDPVEVVLVNVMGDLRPEQFEETMDALSLPGGKSDQAQLETVSL